jgi:transposase
LFYLPPYRPELNLIKKIFSKFKALLRKAAARSIASSISAIVSGTPEPGRPFARRRRGPAD